MTFRVCLLSLMALVVVDPAVIAGEAAAQKHPALTVAVASVTARPMQPGIMATGTVKAWRELQIGSEASGLAVTEVAFEEGQRVNQHDLLVRLNDAVLKAQIRQQRASIEEAIANLKTAEADLKRAQKLLPSQAISEQTADERANAVNTNRAKLAAAEAGLVQLEAQAARTRITAPAGGIVSQRSVNAGQVVSAGTELVRIIQDARLEADALVAEADLSLIERDAAARIIDPAGRAVTGRVRDIAPLVDAKTRLGTVHIALAGDGGGLKPGMFVRVEIAAALAIALAVPRQSLVWRDGGAGVFTVSADNIVALKKVATGRQIDGFVEITSGLGGGETVVSQGAGFLNDGDAVRVEVKAASGEPQ